MIEKACLFASYPSLRVAYIDEVEETSKEGEASKDRSKKIEKVYYSALVKAAVTKPDDPGQKLDQVLWNEMVLIIIPIFETGAFRDLTRADSI